MARNLLSILKQSIPADINSAIEEITKVADMEKANIYFVGGVVRDLLINKPVFDIDLVYEGDAIQLYQILGIKNFSKAILHKRFGTVKLRLGDYNIDIVSARKEQYERPGALPAVTSGSIFDDLARRDFSINSMAIKISNKGPEEIIDPYGGQRDIFLKLIRILHEKSFIDDPTRIFRAIRYEQRFNFNIEPDTYGIIKRDIKMLHAVSRNRITHEFMLFFSEQYPEKILLRSHDIGLLTEFYPKSELEPRIVRLYKTARKYFTAGQLQIAYICLLIYDLNNEQLERFLGNLSFTRQQVLVMRQTITLKNELESISLSSPKTWDIIQLLRKYEPLVIQINQISSSNIKIKKMIKYYLNKLRYIRSALTGEDLIGLGIPSGIRIGKILTYLYKARINGQVKSREEEITLAIKLINAKNK